MWSWSINDLFHNAVHLVTPFLLAGATAEALVQDFVALVIITQLDDITASEDEVLRFSPSSARDAQPAAGAVTIGHAEPAAEVA
eukprot:1955096-Amphidinium_carterae.1